MKWLNLQIWWCVVKKNGFIFFTVVLLISSTVAVFSQQKEEDFGNWYEGVFTYKVAKKTYIKGSLSIRTRDNGLSLNRIHYELGAEKRFFKLIDIGIKIRNRHLFNYDGYGMNQRLIWDLAYKHKLGDFGIQLRNRMQYTFTDGINPLTERIRLKLDYKLENDLKIYLYEELFYRMLPTSRQNVSHLRFGFGANYKVNDFFSIDLSYIRQSEHNKFNPIVWNILQLELNFDF
jgi:hypothetical protein